MTTKFAGTQTEKNLWAAFAGESQARNKYSYFAGVARKEGFEQIAEIIRYHHSSPKRSDCRELIILRKADSLN